MKEAENLPLFCAINRYVEIVFDYYIINKW